ncbi:hypothetical protein [Alteromonas macleodii]|uniref:hypothetical protein n=1 Tax=Alteromonas macleodii TaxID=28108 RepID=UPI002FE0DA72
MKNNEIAIDDYNFQYDERGVCCVKHQDKDVAKFSVLDEYEYVEHCSFWCVDGYPELQPGRLELLQIFLRNAVDEHEIYGRFN